MNIAQFKQYYYIILIQEWKPLSSLSLSLSLSLHVQQ